MRLLTLMVLMILGTLAVRTQQPSPYATRGMLNGLSWRVDSYPEKLAYVDGAMGGYISGACAVLRRLKTNQASCRTDEAVPAWVRARLPATVGDIVKEMDSFYQDGANISIPELDAYVYSEMKSAGATKEELDWYLKAVR